MTAELDRQAGLEQAGLGGRDGLLARMNPQGMMPGDKAVCDLNDWQP